MRKFCEKSLRPGEMAEDAETKPPPWSVHESEAGFVVMENYTGQKLAYVYFEDGPPISGQAAQQNEVRRIAANVAKAAGIAVQAVTRLTASAFQE